MKRGRLVAAVMLSVFCAASTFAQPQAPEIEWSQTYWGDSSDSEISGVLPMPDGGYMLCGSMLPYGAGWVSDMFLLRTDAAGDCVWSQRHGSGYEICAAVLPTADGGFVLVGDQWWNGTHYFDFMLLKTDAQGNCLWSQRYGRLENDHCYSVQSTPDGGYVMVGSTDADSFCYGWLVRTDSVGDSLWSRLYGGDRRNSEFRGIQQTGDSGFMLAGTTSGDFWLVRIDRFGDTLWTRTYGGTGMERCQSVRQTGDGGFILAGWKFPLESLDEDFWLLKTDADGDSLWSRAYGGQNSRDICYGVTETDDGGYLLVGRTSPTGVWSLDGLVIRTDANGDSLWSLRFGGANAEGFMASLRTADGGLVCGGYSQGEYFSNALLVKIGPELIGSERPVVRSVCLLTNYPNPFNSTTHLEFTLPSTQRVSLRLYDVLGREVAVMMNEIKTAGRHEMMFDAAGLVSGVYLCRLEAGGMGVARKMVLVK